MPDNATIVAADAALQPPMYTKRGIALVRGEGVTLWDADGNSYLDAMSNYGVNILGHGHPAVTEAITRQATTLLNAHQSFGNDVRARFLETLLEIAPGNMATVWLCNSGAEAIEAGLKFAKTVTGRNRMVAMQGSYHGRTGAASEVTAPKPGQKDAVEADVIHIPFNNLDALDGVVDDQVAAIIVEPIQGEGGIQVPDEGYLTAAAEAAHRNGALLILDEVQTAFRTGAFFAAEHEGVQADIICTAKALANGVPIGATLLTQEVSSGLPSGLHGSTFGGAPLACAAGLATIQTIQTEGLLARSVELGEQLRGGIAELESPKIRAIRGQGLMTGVELRGRMTPVLRGLQERGVLALPAGTQIVRFLPPLIISPGDVDRIVSVLGETLESV